MDHGEVLKVVQSQLRQAGINHGELEVFDQALKRTVLTDGESVVTRSMRTGDPTLAPMEKEIEWALRASETTRVQVPLVPYPLVSGEVTTSVWQFLPVDRPVLTSDIGEIGELLKGLHQQTPNARVDPISQLETAEQRMRSLITDRPATASLLRPLLNKAHRVLERERASGIVAVHGDAHDRNVLHTPEGLFLIDFDSAGWGPPTLDLASVAYVCRYRFQDLSLIQDLLTGYGPPHIADHDTLMDLTWVRRVRATCTRANRGEDVSALVENLYREEPE